MARGGEAVDDPVAWMYSLGPDVWRQWVAYDRVEPIGCEWERHASQMALLDSIFATMHNGRVTEQRDVYHPRPPEAFLPRGFAPPRPPKQGASIVEQLNRVARKMGFTR